MAGNGGGGGPGGLTVVDALWRALIDGSAGRTRDRHRDACSVLGERFGASLVAVLRRHDEFATVDAVWTPQQYQAAPELSLGPDDWPGRALHDRRRASVFETEAFGPVYGPLLDEIGGGAAALVTPIVEAGVVLGAVVMVAPGVRTLGPEERAEARLCGELLWHRMRHDGAARDFRERAEVAEILARIGGCLHEGGIDVARAALFEVSRIVAGYVGAEEVVLYEPEGHTARPVLRWTSADTGPADVDDSGPAVALDDGLWTRLEHDPILFDGHRPGALPAELIGDHRSGMVLAGGSKGSVEGLMLVGRSRRGPMRRAEVALVTGAVELLSQYRSRLAVEIALVRRGIVEQARSTIAESFVNATADEIGDAVHEALERIGTLFGAERGRWITLDRQTGTGFAVVDWGDGFDGPAVWDLAAGPAAALVGRHEPYVLAAEEVAELTGVHHPGSIIIAPTIGGGSGGAITLWRPGVDRELSDDDRRALADFARLVHQARLRADADREAEHRRRIDDLQLRLAARFLDRNVIDRREPVLWAMGELGVALDLDLVTLAESADGPEGETPEGETLWWTRPGSVAERIPQRMEEHGIGVVDTVGRIIEQGTAEIIRSRLLPAPIRTELLRLSGSEFSALVTPTEEPGVDLLLCVAVLHDREWSAAEQAALRQIVGQIRQFVDVVDSRNQLLHDATHDVLTGLLNRRTISEELARSLAGGEGASVLMIDIDRFKVVNDSLGHGAGDQVLVALAERITASVRGSDLVGRIGGDEFVVIVPRGGDLELAATADRLISVIREPVSVGGSTVIPTCSVGIASAGPGDDVEVVFRHADAALYEAKSKGRDRFEFFDESHRQELRQRLDLETSLRGALADRRFLAHYQPEYDLVHGEIVGVEALVRWDHPTRGVLEAVHFIDLAEEIGLAPDLSRLVLDESLAAVRAWREAGVDTRVRVNITAAQLQSEALADRIRAALRSNAVPADRLCIEITERSLMLDLDAAVAVLRRVRDLGVEVAIDDFGTGFSSLARLKHLPVDTLKIDRSFVGGIVDHRTDREIVRTVVGLCRGLGLDVVAEGVERQDQADLLLELGCRRAQGWLWAPALPASEIVERVRLHRRHGARR